MFQSYYITIRNDEINAVRAVIKFQPNGKRPRGRPRKGWLDGINQVLRMLDQRDWRKATQDIGIAGGLRR